MRRILIAFIALSASALSAQEKETEADRRSYLMGTAQAGWGSRSLSLNALQDYFQDDFLDPGEKATWLSDFPKGIGLGFEYGWRLDYRVTRQMDLSAAVINHPGQVKSAAGDWQVSVYQQDILNFALDPDLMALALNGNAPYAGQTLNFPHSHYQRQYYTGIQYGTWRELWSGQHFAGVTLLVGHRFADYQLDALSLFTATNGAYLDLAGAYRLRDAGGSTGDAIAGMGIAFDYQGRWQKGKQQWGIKVQDLGFIHWTRANSSAFNGSLRFEGVETSNIFELKDSVYRAQEQDLRGELYQEEGDNITALTPFLIEASYAYRWSEVGFYAISAAVGYRHRRSYLPRFSLSLPYRFNKSHQLSADLTFGGFNNYGLGINYLGNWSDHWQIQFGLLNTAPFINGSLLTGSGAKVALVYRL